MPYSAVSGWVHTGYRSRWLSFSTIPTSHAAQPFSLITGDIQIHCAVNGLYRETKGLAAFTKYGLVTKRYSVERKALHSFLPRSERGWTAAGTHVGVLLARFLFVRTKGKILPLQSEQVETSVSIPKPVGGETRGKGGEQRSPLRPAGRTSTDSAPLPWPGGALLAFGARRQGRRDHFCSAPGQQGSRQARRAQAAEAHAGRPDTAALAPLPRPLSREGRRAAGPRRAGAAPIACPARSAPGPLLIARWRTRARRARGNRGQQRRPLKRAMAPAPGRASLRVCPPPFRPRCPSQPRAPSAARIRCGPRWPRWWGPPRSPRAAARVRCGCAVHRRLRCRRPRCTGCSSRRCSAGSLASSRFNIQHVPGDLWRLSPVNKTYWKWVSKAPTFHIHFLFTLFTDRNEGVSEDPEAKGCVVRSFLDQSSCKKLPRVRTDGW